jgi:hypothetical protein
VPEAPGKDKVLVLEVLFFNPPKRIMTPPSGKDNDATKI